MGLFEIFMFDGVLKKRADCLGEFNLNNSPGANRTHHRTVDTSETDENTDEFIGNEPIVNNPQDITNESFLSSILSNIGSRINEVFTSFTPLLSFVKNISSNNNSSQENNEQLIDNFSNLLRATNENVAHKNLLSNESRNALNNLTSVVSHLNENDNVNLRSIIGAWRRSPQAQHLLQMAEHLESNRCTSLNTNEVRELREAFIRGLRTLAEAIRDAEERGEHHALEHLHNAANPLVDGVERADEASRRDNPHLTCEDKRFMGERLQESCHQIDEGVRNGVFNGLDHFVVHRLTSWTNYVYDMIKNFFEEIEEERKEEEKAEKEKQCEIRCEEQKEINILHALHKTAENKKFIFLSLMKKAMMEASITLKAARAALNNPVINYAKHYREIERARREEHRSLCDENDYKRYASNENYYQNLEEDICYQLPPSSVCEDEFSSFPNIDTHC